MTRLGALLLLLLQLHPVFGAAACLRSQLTRHAADCPMPAPLGDGTAIASHSTAAGTAACSFAEICAPAAPALAPAPNLVRPAAPPVAGVAVPPSHLAGAPASAPLPPPPRA